MAEKELRLELTQWLAAHDHRVANKLPLPSVSVELDQLTSIYRKGDYQSPEDCQTCQDGF